MTYNKKRILVAPLNWGLGHATRCIPIICELVEQGADVIIASDGRALLLLQKEFPHLPFIYLPSYHITYGRKKMWKNMLLQLPKIQRAILAEHRAIKKLLQNEKIDFIVSDNRYGCYNKGATNIFVSHQIAIKTGTLAGDWLIRQINHQLIRRFDELWIPDFEKAPGLAGSLSHSSMPIAYQYLGILSRFKQIPITEPLDIVVVLSGPEPQRTYLEEAIIGQAKKINRQFLIVQGKTEQDEEHYIGNIKMISHLTAEALNEVLCACKLVICRSGYSTIMDLVKLGKPAILIPTPGQTEQEYLARMYVQRKLFYSQAQSELNLASAIKTAKQFDRVSAWEQSNVALKETIARLLQG